MSDKVFVDTNVLVYGRDGSEAEKQPKASRWIETLWRSRTGVLSVQVLNEFYFTVTQKLVPGMSRENARVDVVSLMAWNPVAVDGGVIERAWRLQDRFSISWWDSLIVSAAQQSGAGQLLTEDLLDGQSFDGLVVVNPFLHDPRQS